MPCQNSALPATDEGCLTFEVSGLAGRARWCGEGGSDGGRDRGKALSLDRLHSSGEIAGDKRCSFFASQSAV